MRIAWLAPYPAQLLEPALQVSRRVSAYHPCSWIVNLAQALVADPTIELHIITLSHLLRHSQQVRLNHITYHVIKNGLPLTSRNYPAWLPVEELTSFALPRREILSVLRAIRPDLVHAHGTESAYGLSAVTSEFPSLISMQGIVTEIAKVEPSLRFRCLSRQERHVVQHGHFFACRTEFDRAFVQATNSRAKIFQIQEALTPAFFDVNWQLADAATLLYVGHLVPRKGVEVLLQALPQVRAQVPTVRLRLIGAGSADYCRHLRNLVHQLGVTGQVEFLGFQPAAEVARQHRSHQLFVLPSDNENSPNTLAEAMASGLPVIATAVGGIPSMITDRETGRLVARRDVDQLAAVIVELLTQPAERQRLSANARQVARQRHWPAAVAEQTIQAYRAILNS